MASHLHPTRLPSPSLLHKPSPWSTPLTKPTLIHSTTSKKSTTKLCVRGGRGFGLTTLANDKRRLGNNNDNEDNGDEEDAIPELVFNRMIARILSFVGVPMASGIGLTYVLGTLKERGIWESPGWLPFLAILISFGTSALGIAYGTLSTSWDPDNEGSLLGWEEAQKNWPELWKEEEDGKR